MSTHDVDDRREYYRIEDTIALEFTELGAPANEPAPNENTDTESHLFNLLSDLHLMEFESTHLLRQISERDRNLAAYLKVVNKRIDMIGQAVAQRLVQGIGTRTRASLSEGGINFPSEQPVREGSELSLKIVLLPQALGLILRARVVHCEERKPGQYEIGCIFPRISDAQRQLLARHILQKQAMERRKARE